MIAWTEKEFGTFNEKFTSNNTNHQKQTNRDKEKSPLTRNATCYLSKPFS